MAALEYIRHQPGAKVKEYAAGIWQDPRTGKFYRTQLTASVS